MAEIRALIVDDEPLARRGILQLLARHPDMRVVGECRNGKEALKAAETMAFDLLFLDVQMPGMGGFEVIRRWSGSFMPAIVFVTAYVEFAVRAFDACALDYLVKPVSERRFDAAMIRVRERIRLGDAAAKVARLTALLEQPPALIVSLPHGQLALDASEVDWIEARDYCACIHAGDRRYLIRESLSSLERRLDERFCRVHRSAIVRLAQVREIRTTLSDGIVAILKGGARVPVSRRRRDRLEQQLRSKVSPAT